MKPVEPIQTVELFPSLGRELLKVLRQLRPADWERPTVCGPWTVKDVAAHLLGGSLGRLWMEKPPKRSRKPKIQDYDELLKLIDRENDRWVKAARRISPEILIEMLALTDRRLYKHFACLGPDAPAGITVAWAGDTASPNWFDIAREYTEKWLHQQHIREAVGEPLLTERRWLAPVLDTFLRGLPHAFRSYAPQEGTSVAVHILGEAGGDWSVTREGAGWVLFAGSHPAPSASVEIDQDLAWRVFTKGVSAPEARKKVRIRGDVNLGANVLEMVSLMA